MSLVCFSSKIQDIVGAFHNNGYIFSQQIKEVNKKFGGESGAAQLSIPVRLWQAPGCHEFLASLGFDLLEVGKDEVTVKAGKQANRRTLSFALQALVAVFGK